MIRLPLQQHFFGSRSNKCQMLASQLSLHYDLVQELSIEVAVATLSRALVGQGASVNYSRAPYQNYKRNVIVFS